MFPSAVLFLLLVLPVCLAGSGAQCQKGEHSSPEEKAVAESDTGTTTEAEGRTDLNLLGKVDADSGESRRNENVQFNAVDNNVQKELNIRLGAKATLIDEFRADSSYFGAELGGEVKSEPHIATSGTTGFHGSVYYSHNNSIFNARSFFQVGKVKPAHENNYGFTAGVPVWRSAYLSLDGSQQKIRGNVNGNVLVPKPDERTPLTHDPELIPVVERFLGVYPAELPNRTDINPRALNTNSPQRINDDNIGGRLDQFLGGKDRLSFDYRFTLQKVDAFQLIAGQNPDTTTRAHRAGVTWSRQWSAATVTDFSVAFDRITSLLVPEENSIGPSASISRALTTIGPSSLTPIDQAQNLYRFAGQIHRLEGRHSLYAGFDLTRRQFNGSRANAHRGMLSFRNEFGRDAITNLRMGIASRFAGSVGNVRRGFRQWMAGFFVGDDWKATPNLTLNFSLRYAPVTRPVEVHQFNELPYSSDLNNLAPNAGFAWRLPGAWGVLRAAYGLQYGDIFPVTYGEIRYNPPWNQKFQYEMPDLRLPISELLQIGAENPQAATLIWFPDDLVTPYAHEYNFSWQPLTSTRWSLRLGYVGSRSLKLFSMWTFNRARPVPGIPQTSETVQQRRPDQSVAEVRHLLNGSRGYFDAAKASFDMRLTRGLFLEASYWFSKAIDLGTDYTNTVSGPDAWNYRSQSEFNVQQDLKGLSQFDQPHSFLLRGTFEVPEFAGGAGWVNRVLGNWVIGIIALAKSGTPFTVESGSDAPGYGNVDGTRRDRPNVVDPSVLGRTIGNPDTSRQLLPVSAFAFIQPTDERGNLGQGTFRKGRIANVNAMLTRTFPVANDLRLVFRAESVNFFNTPQFAEPGRYLSSPDFGSITNTLNDGRAFNFMLRFEF